MPVLLRVASAVLASALSLSAGAAEPASAPASGLACFAPGPDRAANRACATGIAQHAEAERLAGHNEAALAAFARADEFFPDDLRFSMARAGLALKIANQLSPAGIEAAAGAAPDDVGLRMLHAELAAGRKDYAAALADVDRVLAARPRSAMAWETRASINASRPDFAAARADVDRAMALDPKSPPALRLRGVLRSNEGDYAGALADYETARALAPRPDDPFVIGSTQFLMRQFGAAAATLARAAPPAPSGTYWLLWRYMALARLTGVERASGSLGPSTAPGARVPWPVPVIDYFQGNIDAATLLDFANKSQAAKDLSQVCEAHFYMAEDALLRQHGDAIALLRQAAGECPANFHEYEGAVAELKAAGLPLTPPGPTLAAASAASGAD
jgi:lipoprotein NlpI